MLGQVNPCTPGSVRHGYPSMSVIFYYIMLYKKQDKQDKAMIGSPGKSMTKQKLEEQVSNAIFYFFIQHDIK